MAEIAVEDAGDDFGLLPVGADGDQSLHHYGEQDDPEGDEGGGVGGVFCGHGIGWWLGGCGKFKGKGRGVVSGWWLGIVGWRGLFCLVFQGVSLRRD